MKLLRKLVKGTRKRLYHGTEPGYVISWISTSRQKPPVNQKVILWNGNNRFMGYWTGERYLGLTPTGWVDIEPKAWFLIPPSWDEIELIIEKTPFRKLRWRYIFYTRVAWVILLSIIGLILFLIWTLNYFLG